MSLRAEQQVAGFARGTLATRAAGAPVRVPRGPRVRIGGRDGQAHGAERRHVRQVVAHEGDLIRTDAQPGSEFLHLDQLVLDAGEYLHAQLTAARHRDGTAAGGDEGDFDAGTLQQHQALAVLHMECFLFAALAVQEQAAIGQRAVHVEARQPDARGTGQHVVGQVVEMAERHDRKRLVVKGGYGGNPAGYTTRARNRS